MSSGRLPAELYQEIVQNTQSRTDLLSLITVSRLISYEAERVLYRTIIVEKRGYHSRGAILASKFSHYERVSGYIQSATFRFYEDCSEPTLHHIFIPILLSLTNLKALTLMFKFFNLCNATPFIYHLPEEVPFRLFQLTIYSYKNDDVIVPFVRSQSSLRKLTWRPGSPNVSISPLDLPHLIALASSHPTLIQSILPGRNVTQLDCRRARVPYLGSKLWSGTSYPSVRALALPFIDDLARIPEVFPAVQYLFIDHSLGYNLTASENLLPHLNLFEHLNRLKMSIRSSSRTLASEVFTCNKHITIAELYIEPKLFKFKRGFEKDVSLVSSERVASIQEIDPW